MSLNEIVLEQIHPQGEEFHVLEKFAFSFNLFICYTDRLSVYLCTSDRLWTYF